MRIRNVVPMLVVLAAAGCWGKDPLSDSGGPYAAPYQDGSGYGSGSGFGGVDAAVWGGEPPDIDAGGPDFDSGTGGDWDAGRADPDSGGTAKSDGCALHAYYMDADRDGFGDPTNAVLGCAAPAGHVDNAQDCYDGNALAHPGQQSFFTVNRGDGSYDYDCDGAATKQLPNQDPKTCDCNGAQCAVSSGYRAPIPTCGAAADFAIGGEQSTCDPTVVPVTQPCR